MRFELDHQRRTVGVTTVASSNGQTITQRRNLELEGKLIAARFLYLASLEEWQCLAGKADMQAG